MTTSKTPLFLCAIVLLASCGGNSIKTDTVAGYFSGLSQQVQLAGANAQMMPQEVAQAICNDVKVTNDDGKTTTKATFTYKDCEQNGIRVNGELVYAVTNTDNPEKASASFKGDLSFKVLNPADIAIAECQNTLKKDDTASCTISLESGKDGKMAGTACGLSNDDFTNAITTNACQKADEKTNKKKN